MQELAVTGTDIWYYFICKREVWFNMRKIAPDEDDDNIQIGRFIHEYRYRKEKKEIAIDSIKIDAMKKRGGTLIVQEIKKSSKFSESTKYQLLYYLYTLKKMGIEAEGELLFPEERHKETVILDDNKIQKLQQVEQDIIDIASKEIPPPPARINFCKSCAYREYCWAEG